MGFIVCIALAGAATGGNAWAVLGMAVAYVFVYLLVMGSEEQQKEEM